MNVKRKFVKNTMDMIFLPLPMCETSLYYKEGRVDLFMKDKEQYVGRDYDSDDELVRTFEYTSYKMLEDHIEFIGGESVREYGYPYRISC